ncbi:MAG: NAD(P)/FAD-dependent oxidoreductase [Hyphomicrobiales bacterium]|nr:MAG: NAD(P)/FAD-dependent oxidoreductase [Hyphomicrobiales bacterium]
MRQDFATQGLADLARRIHDDLEAIAHPRAAWLTPRTSPQGGQAFDVVIVGAGQSGLVTAFALMRSEVRNILVLDKAPRDREGPWRTYARMRTLRSPKDFTGPDLDIPSLTYQAYHEARFGREAWQQLDLIPKDLWADYLIWYRDVLGLPVANERDVVDIRPEGDLLALTVARPDGAQETVFARKVVLATGQEGLGDWALPAPLAGLPAPLRAVTSDPIDFGSLAGKTVAVVGAGASAFDNAATALEAGATRVLLLCRREEPQVIQPYRWLTFRGFLRHLCDLDDAWRWRFMQKILDLREGFPQATFDRCARHHNFELVRNARLVGAREVDGRVHLQTTAGEIVADFVIAATGIEMDFSVRPELARFAGNIATWGDRYTPPPEERDDRLACFPYLADDYALTEKVPGETPWLRNIHLFSIASTMSFGPSGSSINAMTTAVPKLVYGLTRGLFREDAESHWRALQAYDVPQAIVPRAPE